MPVKDIQHGVDQGDAGDEKQHACSHARLRRVAQMQQHAQRRHQRSSERAEKKRDLQVKAPVQQFLPQIKAQKGCAENQPHSHGIAVKQAAKGGIGAGHKKTQQHRVKRGHRADGAEMLARLGKAEVFIGNAPAQGIERRHPLKIGRTRHNGADRSTALRRNAPFGWLDD